MSNNAPGPWGPPQGQPGPGGWGQQPQNQWGQQPPLHQWGQQPGPGGPFGPGGYGGPPQPPRRVGNPGLGILAGVVAMFVGAGLYGWIVSAAEIESTYFGLGVAALIAFAMGKIGGSNVALPIVAVLLALLGVFLGQLWAIVLFAADQSHGFLTVSDILADYTEDVFESWKEEFDAISALVFGFAGFAAFGITKSVGDR